MLKKVSNGLGLAAAALFVAILVFYIVGQGTEVATLLSGIVLGGESIFEKAIGLAASLSSA